MNNITWSILVACIFLIGYKMGLESKTAPIDLNDEMVTKVKVNTLNQSNSK